MKRIDQITCSALDKCCRVFSLLTGIQMKIDWEDHEQKILLATEVRRVALTQILPFALMIGAMVFVTYKLLESFE